MKTLIHLAAATTLLAPRSGAMDTKQANAALIQLGKERLDVFKLTRQLLSCEARMGRNPVCDGSEVSCRGHLGRR